jgi:hypothetical protein
MTPDELYDEHDRARVVDEPPRDPLEQFSHECRRP